MESSSRKLGGLGLWMVALMLMFMFAAPGAGWAKPVTLRLAHSEAVTNIRHEIVLMFVKRVDELSKGEVKIDVYPAGALGTHTSCQEEVAMGTLDFYITTAGLVSVFDPQRTQELIELPYLFDTYSQAYAFMDTPFVTKFYDPLKAKGIRYLWTWDNGFRHMTNNVRPIFTPQDMKGLKIRVVKSEMSMNIINAMGGNAVPMSYSELYTALGQGVVDGQENPLSAIYYQKFYEVQKHVALTQHAYACAMPLIGTNSWSKLTKEQQNILREESKKAGEYVRKTLNDEEKDLIAKFEKAGLKVTRPDIAAFRAKMGPAYEKIFERYGQDNVKTFMKYLEEARKK